MKLLIILALKPGLKTWTLKYDVTSVSLKFEPYIKCNCEYLQIGFLYWHLVYLNLKGFGMTNLQYEIRFAKKAIIQSQLQFMCGLWFEF